ncbi:ATP-binding protein [Paractinoplanes deccanensis]|nr:ATP-binding protein [Actinoplanes deccanensis]
MAVVLSPAAQRFARQRPYKPRGKGPAVMEHLRQLDQDQEVLADEPLTTKEGWARFVARRPAPPAAGDGVDTGDARIDYLSELVMLNTPVVAEVVATARRLVLLNRRQLSARRGLIVTGVPGTGKTTAITALGRTHEVAVRRRQPHEPHRVPVVYVTVPPAATPRMLAVEFARFFGLPVAARANITDVTNAVCATAGHVGVELVLVDEVHNLNLATRAGAEVSDQLKYFAERLPATFVYAGVDVERVGLFAGPRGQQIASRFTTIPTTAFAYGTSEQRALWRALVASMEATLSLRDHQPGTLAALDEYLHRRTAGMIGSLSHLARGAAIDAILDGTEHLTRAHLDRVRLDHAADAYAAAHPAHMPARRAAANTTA